MMSDETIGMIMITVVTFSLATYGYWKAKNDPLLKDLKK